MPKRLLPHHLLIAMAVLLAAGNHAAAQMEAVLDKAALSPIALPYPGVDPGLGEALSPGENALAQEIALVLEESIRKEYRAGTARRDAHPKAHGCVKAEFHVLDAIPVSLAKGIFVPGKTYQAWIRFSNGSKDATRADSKGDARGMAIKVLGISGRKLLEAEAGATTQDFILISHPVFFTNDPRRYLSLIQHASSSGFSKKLLIPLDLGLQGSLIALKTTRKKISNPLQARYWSTVPYQLGTGPDRRAVKYSARACAASIDAMPIRPGDNFLRDGLRTSLQNGDACMAFLVQTRASESMSVEDSMTEWEEAQAPFIKVAEIRIPRQVFDTPDQNLFCENLSFSPWHALPDHRPLGVMNRMRRVIYEHISRVRHEMNSADRHEPE